MTNVYCIGDIHGCFKELDTLLKNLNIKSSDSFIFLGDYVDRGPDSYKVIERLLELNQTNNCVFLWGNHDKYWWQDAAVDQILAKKKGSLNYRFWDEGAKETYKSYIKNNKDLLYHHNSFYKLLKMHHILEINDKKHFFVHGGYNRHQLLKDQNDKEVFIWDRDLLFAAKSYHSMKDQTHPFKNKDKFDYIYVGHTPVSYWGYTSPQLWGNIWALDTGLGKYLNSKLYALEITTQTLIS